MRYIQWIILCLLLTSCGQEAELQQVRDQLNMTLATIPSSPDFTTIETAYENFSSDPKVSKNGFCFYARAYRLIGTQIPKEQVLATYAALLQTEGWIVQAQDINSNTFIRGENEDADVFLTETTYMHMLFDYAAAYQRYPTVFVATITYKLPQRQGC
ncbi:MAG: hypothetical protein H0T53_11465 [Herpetosiphonaceae bacterium]|nr:hypothetical protein [Herpetosiphonaceae bacterium]